MIKCQSIMANPNPKPPKRKKGTAYSRHASGKKNKQTNYDFRAASAAELALEEGRQRAHDAVHDERQ